LKVSRRKASKHVRNNVNGMPSEKLKNFSPTIYGAWHEPRTAKNK
jgi:hypothetical protein